MEEITNLISNPDIWSNQKTIAPLMKEKQKISSTLDKIKSLEDNLSLYSEYFNSFPDELISYEKELLKLEEEISDFEFSYLMRDPINKKPAILTIHAGAGGLEAANWVSMLLRMYVRWAEFNKLDVETLYIDNSEEHSSMCVNAVSIQITGPYAYGFLKHEGGIHRLIRNSPFNAGDARHTSFAAVHVTPDIEESGEMDVPLSEIEIIAQTSGKKGGQNSNKVCSAIRAKHLPTGISVFIRTERDQLANKKIALKILKSKVYDLEMQKKNEEKEKELNNLSKIAFGSQIRTYTLSPYSLVKDHRTNFEINNADLVLEGNIQEILLNNLREINDRYNNG